MTETQTPMDALAQLIALLGGKHEGTGEHSHKCNECGHIWSHEDSCLNDKPHHTCRCGVEQWYVFNDHREGTWESCARHGGQAQQTPRRGI